MLDPHHFKNLLSNPETTVEEDLEKLEKLLEEHPYLQSARALQLKIYKQKNSELYNDALRKTAAHTTDRDVLFQFITSESFASKEASTEEKNIIDSEPVDKEAYLEKTEISIEEESEAKVSDKKQETAIEEPIYDKKEPEESEDIDEDTAKEILELDQPLSFNKEDTYSFSEWLQLTSRKPIDRENQENQEKKDIKEETKESNDSNKTPKTEKVIHMVDTFLKNNPRPKRKPETFNKRESDELELEFNNEAPKSLMTETLARVYLQQKNYKKAIQAYKILILKNPEKSGYFADKIRAIEKLTN